MLRFCLALLVFNEPGDVLAAVIGEPQVSARRANALGNSAARSELWDQGKVNYVVQTEESSPGAQFPHLPEDYQPVIDAIAEWEKKTCIRFTRCRIEADCPKPYLVFRHSITWKCEITAVEPGVLHIVLSVLCGSDANRMIGRVMGLDDEFMRSDRDNYVRMTNEYGQTVNADPSSSLGRRNIGVYDYASIMHQKRAVSDAGLLIETTEVIGASRALSEGDVAAIDFMYNGCSNTYAAPRCITNASAVLLIPHSKEFVVEFNADWNADSSMTISYGSTTAPRASFHTVPGTNVGHSATAFITFNPLLADAGSTFMLAATFTSTGAGAESSTCQVEVKVATGDHVCFGISADDESVCGGGGRGRCTTDPGIPCSCTGKHTGKQCEEHPCMYRYDPTSPPCYEYLMFGNLTRPTMEALTGGGLMLTVSIAGGDDWVDSEATKQAFIDGLTPDFASPSSTGWSVLQSTMMNTELVTISGSTLTLGPLMPAASFFTAVPTVVSLTLDASMMTSGTLGVGSDDLFFVVPASPTLCMSEHLAFDTDASSFSGAVVDTSFSAEGLGSAYFGVSTFLLQAFFYPAGDKYTSISYYIATNDSSVIGIGQAETRFRGCWWMTIAATGLKFASSLSSSDTDIFVNMPIELNRFYFVEHLIDYSTGMMTVRVDGEVKIENFASKSGTTCISHGIGGFAFRRKGWVDELRLQVACSLYELTGSMTSPDHRGLDGGMLTVSIKGDPDVWVDTEATKQALIDGLVAVTSSTALTGWNALKSTMMDTSLVSISGSKMTLGPLNPVAYSATSATVVSLTLTASMAASGTLKRGSGGLFFVIPAPMCFSDRDITFNSDSATFPNSMVDTSFKAEGRGSAYFGESGASVYSVSEPLNRGRFLYISYYIAMNDTDYLPSIDILDSSLNSCWVMEITSTGLLFHGNIVADMPLELNRFYFVENLIDPYTRAMTVRVDGAVKLEYPLAMKANSSCNTGIDHIVFWRKGWLDRLRLQQHCLWH